MQLTMMYWTRRQVGEVMVKILAKFDWRVVGMLFHNHEVNKGLGNSPCHFTLASVFAELDKRGHKSVYKSFDETSNSVNFTQLLLHIGQRSRSEFETLERPTHGPPFHCVQIRPYAAGSTASYSCLSVAYLKGVVRLRVFKIDGCC